MFSLILVFYVNAQDCWAENEHITYVLITVDMEGPSPSAQKMPYYGKCLLPDQVNAAIEGLGCGISKMMDIADKYNFRISFFLDVMEVKLFGEQKMKSIVNYILSRGHDLQLHIDSLYLVDPDRPYLSQYSLEEQKRIIADGQKLIASWTGKWPIAHRAGAYAANADTLTALKEASIPIDSSFFYNNKRCKLQNLYSTKNTISKKYNIIQLPVTVFEVLEYCDLAGIKLKPVRRYKKLDVDSCTGEEIKVILAQAAENDLDTVTLFLHSWSFIKHWSDNKEGRRADTNDINEFDDILNFIHKHNKLSTLSMEDFYKKFNKNELLFSYRDFVPKLERKTYLVNYLRRLAGINRQNVNMWVIGIILGCILIFLSTLRLKMKRKNK